MDAINDVLEDETVSSFGHWLTPQDIMNRTGLDIEAIGACLYRMRKDGLIRSRFVTLEFPAPGRTPLEYARLGSDL